MIVQVREARITDVKPVAAGLSAIDARECLAFGREPRLALRRAYEGAEYAWTGLVDGRPHVMFGVSRRSLASRTGTPWLLGSEEARRCWREFVVYPSLYLPRMAALFDRLENFVHVENRRSIRWLEKLGFTVEPETVYPGSEPMRRFWMERGALDV